MKDRRAVALSLVFIAVFFLARSGYAIWSIHNVLPIAEFFNLPYEDPLNAERFGRNLRFSVVLFGLLALVTAVSSWAIFSYKQWARWLWLVACTVMSFSYLYSLIVSPAIAIEQYDLIFVCIVSWILLGGNGLSRKSAP